MRLRINYVLHTFLAAFLLFAVAACADRTEPGEDMDPDETMATEEGTDAMMADTTADESIVDIIMNDSRFSTLAAALDSADLITTLEGPGPFTVFAPTNEAFAALPEGQLDELLMPENRDRLTTVLSHHVIRGEITAADAGSRQGASSLAGDSLHIMSANGSVMIDDATVTEPDLDASNGIVHVIDSVIMPAMAQ